MTDVCDRAAEREESFRNAALAAQKHRISASRPVPENEVGHCRLCGEPIPVARRRALLGVATCVDCQTRLERSAKKGLRQ